jgi:hypothetical protein
VLSISCKFCEEIDNLFLNGLSYIFTSYRCHADPIVPTSELLRVIEQAPVKFGDYWHYRCHQRGVGNDLAKRHSLFFSILGEIRASHKYRLGHWALVDNIADYCRGIRVASEKMSCYFRHHVHPTRRTTSVNELAGNDKASRESGNTLTDK